MAVHQAQRRAAPRQQSRGGSASPPNPKSSLDAPLHLLGRRSPLSRLHLKLTSKRKTQPQAKSRSPAAKLMPQSSLRDLCRRGTGGPLRRKNSPSPNPNPPSFIPTVLNWQESLQRRTCQTNVLRAQWVSERKYQTKSLLLCRIKRPLRYRKGPRLWCRPG